MFAKQVYARFTTRDINDKNHHNADPGVQKVGCSVSGLELSALLN